MESRDAYFDRVYADCAAGLKRFLIVRIRSADDMEEIYQETWRRFYERTRLLRPEAPFGYLVKIAKGELGKRYRLNSREESRDEVFDERVPDGASSFEPELIDRMDAARVFALVRTEPLLSYKAFVLYYGFDRSVRQIATALCISEDAVKARLYRTRERIRAQWKGDGQR